MTSPMTPDLAGRTRAPSALLLILCLAAGGASGGVLIGNPVVCRVEAAPGESISSASGFLDEYELDDCGSKTATVSVDETVDLATGEEWTLPTDDWCTLTLRFHAGLTIVGVANGAYSEATVNELVLDRVSGSPDGFAMSDVGLSAAAVRLVALVD